MSCKALWVVSWYTIKRRMVTEHFPVNIWVTLQRCTRNKWPSCCSLKPHPRAVSWLVSLAWASRPAVVRLSETWLRGWMGAHGGSLGASLKTDLLIFSLFIVYPQQGNVSNGLPIAGRSVVGVRSGCVPWGALTLWKILLELLAYKQVWQLSIVELWRK